MTPERAEEVLKLSLEGRYVAACGPAGEEAMALKIIAAQRDAALLQIRELEADKESQRRRAREAEERATSMDRLNGEFKAALLDASRLLTLFALNDLTMEDVRAFLPIAEALCVEKRIEGA